jgi:hypothetical protein
VLVYTPQRQGLRPRQTFPRRWAASSGSDNSTASRWTCRTRRRVYGRQPPQYTLLLFPSTNNDVFDTDAQRLAFRRYIEAGGGFVGLHSVLGTERNWKWFKHMLGGTFSWHAKFQPFSVRSLTRRIPRCRACRSVGAEGRMLFPEGTLPGSPGAAGARHHRP